MSGFPTCAATWDVRKSKSSIDRCSSITAKCRIVLYSAYPWIQSKRVSSSKKSHCHENMKLSTLSREMCPTLLVVWRRGSKVVDAGAVVLLYMNSSTSIFVLGKRESICRCSPPPRFKSNEATGDSACCATKTLVFAFARRLGRFQRLFFRGGRSYKSTLHRAVPFRDRGLGFRSIPSPSDSANEKCVRRNVQSSRSV